jgi:hypothetical protein
LNITATGQAYVPRRIIGNTIAPHYWWRAGQNHLRAFQNVSLNTTTRYRTHETPIGMDQHMRTDWARRRLPRFDHRRNRHRRAGPFDCGGEDTIMIGAARLHG